MMQILERQLKRPFSSMFRIRSLVSVVALSLACGDGSTTNIAGGYGVVPAPVEIFPEEVQIDPDARVQVRHIVIAWAGARGANATLRRTREEAWIEIRKIQDQLQAGEDFATLAESRSDGPSGKKGGALGVIEPGQMHAIFQAAAFSLAEDEISPIIETPFGFHIIERQELVEIHIRQLVVQWTGARRSEVERSQAEALERAQLAMSEIQAGRTFADVAREFSDGPVSDWGGDLGHFRKGVMLPKFEASAFALEPDTWTDIIESDQGYHILYREG